MAQSAHIPAGTGQRYWLTGNILTYLVTGKESGGRQFTVEALVPAGSGFPAHIHTREDEQLYVLDGEFTFWVGDQSFRAATGDVVYAPIGVIHGLRNDGAAPGRLLLTFAPAGIEQFFHEAFPTVDGLPDMPDVEAILAHAAATEPKYGQETVPVGDPRLSKWQGYP